MTKLYNHTDKTRHRTLFHTVGDLIADIHRQTTLLEMKPKRPISVYNLLAMVLDRPEIGDTLINQVVQIYKQIIAEEKEQNNALPKQKKSQP